MKNLDYLRIFGRPQAARATGGAVNQVRLAGFRDYLRRGRPADSLATPISADERIRDPNRASDAHAEAWALNYFLIRQFSGIPRNHGFSSAGFGRNQVAFRSAKEAPFSRSEKRLSTPWR